MMPFEFREVFQVPDIVIIVGSLLTTYFMSAKLNDPEKFRWDTYQWG